MKKRALALLRCPACRGELKADAARETSERILDGRLRCTLCDAEYPVRGGVPLLLPPRVSSRETADRFAYQWAKQSARLFEREKLYGKSEEEEFREFLEVLDLRPGSLTRLHVLDAGCGVGRLTRKLAANCETAIGMDLARTVHEVDSGEASFVRGDILSSPFAPEAFDIVWSQGVIHHTGETREAFRALARLVRPGGLLYVWVYPKKRTRYMKVRDAIRIGHRLPPGALFVLSYLLAAAVWVWKLPKNVRHRFRKVKGRRDYSLRRFAFDFFDNLAPPYQSRHSEEEVRQWFAEESFEAPRLCGRIAFTGRRAGDGSRGESGGKGSWTRPL